MGVTFNNFSAATVILLLNVATTFLQMLLMMLDDDTATIWLMLKICNLNNIQVILVKFDTLLYKVNNTIKSYKFKFSQKAKEKYNQRELYTSVNSVNIRTKRE